MRAILPIAAPVALAAALLVAHPTSAHHGWGSYDAGQTLELTGTVRQIHFDNPHGMMRLEVSGKTWVVVLAPPARMRARGLTPEMVAVGKSVSVVGYPHRNDETEMRAERVIAEGKTVELR